MLPAIFKTRGPVVHLDRQQKARMIEAFLSDALGSAVVGRRILDIGCGNGKISSHFSRRNKVVGVDVQDLRHKDVHPFEFHLLDSARLPFDAESFDIVLSHHVIEHIPEQGIHLDEMHRVLRRDGIGYVGTPNKSSPIMEGHVANSLVLRYSEMEALWRAHGFQSTLLSLKLASQPDRYHGDVRFGRYIPRIFLRLLIPWFPSHYFLLRKA